MNLLAENMGRNLHEFELVSGVLHTTPKTQALKEKIDTLDIFKVYSEKKNSNLMNGIKYLQIICT